MIDGKLKSIGVFIEEISYRLPRLEAEILCAIGLNSTREKLIAYSDELLNAKQIKQCFDLVQKRERGVPIAYLSKCREFYGIEFFVTPSVLIPRPETEFLVDQALRYLKKSKKGKILELGTGCGAISIAVKKNAPDSYIVATDISHEALDVAKYNASRLIPKDRGKTFFLLEGSWYDALKIQSIDCIERLSMPGLINEVEKKPYFDLILANPPYIAFDDPSLCQGDLRFEPLNALTDYQNGLSAIEHIISYASDWLFSGGELWLEHGYTQKDFVVDIFLKNNFINIRTVQDFSGLDRVTGGCLRANS